MNAQGHAFFAQVLAANARVYAMHTDNMVCQNEGRPLMHNSDAFRTEAQDMESLASDIRNYGWKPD